MSAALRHLGGLHPRAMAARVLNPQRQPPMPPPNTPPSPPPSPPTPEMHLCGRRAPPPTWPTGRNTPCPCGRRSHRRRRCHQAPRGQAAKPLLSCDDGGGGGDGNRVVALQSPREGASLKRRPAAFLKRGHTAWTPPQRCAQRDLSNTPKNNPNAFVKPKLCPTLTCVREASGYKCCVSR